MIESKFLKDNVQNIQKLMTIPALRNWEAKSLSKLLRLSKIREYEDQERIIREGALDPWLYFLLSGAIRVQKNDVSICVIDKAGEIFGEMRIIDSRARSASVHAVGRTICLAVDTSAASRVGSSDPLTQDLDYLLLLYRIFAEFMSMRLRVTNEELVLCKKKLASLATP